VKRRDFFLLAGAMMACPRAALAQSDKVSRLGILVLGNPDPGPFMKGLRDGLRDLGYAEGRNVAFEFRSAEGNSSRLAPLAAELLALKVDVLLAFQTPAASAAKRATTDIPIVMFAGDPVGTGLIESLARPGGNVTGLTGAGAELGAKNVELIREVMPAARRVGVLANANDPFSKPFLGRISEAGQALKVEIKPYLLTAPGGYEAAFTDMAKSRSDALIMQPSLSHSLTAELALKHRLPSFSPNSDFPIAGGLMGYSADYDVFFRESAAFVDKILKGRKPADLPVQLPTKFWLAINLKTAKAIGVTVPGTMLTRADNVIE
jgi:putative tryptophan/tyrosine transport system substrate-binding protein